MKTQKTTFENKQGNENTGKKDTPLARQSRKRAGRYFIYIFFSFLNRAGTTRGRVFLKGCEFDPLDNLDNLGGMDSKLTLQPGKGTPVGLLKKHNQSIGSYTNS